MHNINIEVRENAYDVFSTLLVHGISKNDIHKECAIEIERGINNRELIQIINKMLQELQKND